MRKAALVGLAALIPLVACTGKPAAVHLQRARVTPPAVASPSPAPEPTSAWMLSDPGYDTQGYASTTSAAPGDTVTLYVSSHAMSWWGDVYRMGWYGGLGGALMQSLPVQAGTNQGGHTPIEPATGLIRADWKPSLQLTIPAGWPSGMYMIKLTDSTGQQSYIPLVVRGRGLAPLVMIHSSATDEAYNLWGGQSLYQGTTPDLHLGRAAAVSFDRPFNQDYGAGDFFYWEFQMARFLDRNGIEPDFLTDVDVSQHPDWLQGYRAVLIAGHDEYWSPAMRAAYQGAVANGVSLAVFAGNTAYRPIRFEASPVGPDRVIVTYKNASLDPQHSTSFNWREPPWNWYESSLLGVGYVSTGNIRQLPWIVADASSWVFHNTGLRNGDALPGLLGYEQDAYAAGAPHPAGVDVLSDSPVPTTGGAVVRANGAVYTAASGAVVFDAGSIQWSWGLDSFKSPSLIPGLRQTFVTDRRPDYSSPAAQTIALNVLRRMLGSRFPSARRGAAPPPAPTPGEPVPSFAPTEAPPPGPPDEG